MVFPDISRFFSGGGEFWINQDYENRSHSPYVVWGEGGGAYVNAVILLVNIRRGEEPKFHHAYAELFHWSTHIYSPC
jgi:hypothetical protein